MIGHSSRLPAVGCLLVLLGVVAGAFLGPRVGDAPVDWRTPLGFLVDLLRLGFFLGLGLLAFGVYQNRKRKQ